jgi:hypothetical protein
MLGDGGDGYRGCATKREKSAKCCILTVLASRRTNLLMRRALYLLVLVAAGLLLPLRSSADSFTISTDQDTTQTGILAFSFSTVMGFLNHVSTDVTLVLPLGSPAATSFEQDLAHGKDLPSLWINAIADQNNVPTIVEIIELGNVEVVKDQFTGGGNSTPVFDVTLAYSKIKTVSTNPNGGSAGTGSGGSGSTPEPATLILLGSGLAGICGLRKKQRA